MNIIFMPLFYSSDRRPPPPPFPLFPFFLRRGGGGPPRYGEQIESKKLKRGEYGAGVGLLKSGDEAGTFAV